jgi:hypothetical protein
MKPTTTVVNGRTYTHRTYDGNLARLICEDRLINSDNYMSEKMFLILYANGNERLASCKHEIEDITLGTTPPVNWSKVAVDTPIWVRGLLDQKWLPRHFSHYDGWYIYAFNLGTTSHTSTQSAVKWNMGSLEDPNLTK